MDEEFELTEHDRQVLRRLNRELWIVESNEQRGDLPPVDLHHQPDDGDNHRPRKNENETGT